MPAIGQATNVASRPRHIIRSHGKWASAAAAASIDHMDAEDLDRTLALHFSCCEQAGIEPLPDDEAREQARR